MGRPGPAPTVDAPPRRFLAGYRTLLDVPGFWRLATIGLASKLAPGMLGLSLLLLVGGTFSYATAGLAVSCSALGQGLSAPLRGRLIDRFAAGPVLLGCLVAHLTATAVLLVTVSRAGPPVAVLAAAAAVGATNPPVGVMMRTVWRHATDGEALTTAMALDASMMGAALITGPALAGWLSLSLSPVAPVLVLAVLTAGTVVLLIGGPPVSPRPVRSGRRAGLLAAAPVRRLLVTNGLFVMAVTALDVVLPSYAREFQVASLTGVYLGVLSIGSVLGSFALGAAAHRLRADRRLRLHLGVFAAGSAALALSARWSPLAVLLVCPAAGLMIGSLFATLRTLGGDLAPHGRVTETMSWLSTLDMAGGAAGAAVFAQLADAQGSRAALALIPVLLLAAAAVSPPAR
ncbi:MFS family permease [Actinoplanes octamycinicus]|uniref:MFS family permease n=1 Tax=Actinoplanes octamycinicus TaxID=135948 RepID=A0A7W7H115_9ACTN|nr:MFS transporter [Actinoplanes octamycinicus]MBB4741869.1 MFS family permease [Actinoplanes octamycinicus]GIE60632.1 MFS transporter [Actinoplanes octamycinicus]